MKSGTWKRLICFALTFDLAGAPLLVHAADHGYEANRNGRNQKPNGREDAEDEIEKAAKAALATADSHEVIDTWSLRDQDVEIIENKDQFAEIKGKYAINDSIRNYQRPVFTKLEPYVDANCDNCVAFLATRGMNNENKNGTYVARTRLRGVSNIAALAADEELIHVVENTGRIHLIDNGFASAEVFRSVIPVERNVWEPKEPLDLEGKTVVARYVTLASRAPNLETALPDAVIPRKANGDVAMKAGDLIVEVDGRLLGIFNREVSHARLEISQRVLLAQAAWIKKDRDSVELLGKLFKEEQRNIDAFREALVKAESQSVDPMVALAMSSMGDAQFKSLLGQLETNGKNSSAGRPRDRIALNELIQNLEATKLTVAAENPVRPEAELAMQWQKALPHLYAEDDSRTIVQDVLIDKLNVDAKKAVARTERYAKYTKITGAVALLMLGLTLPIGIEALPETLQQNNVVSFIYQTYPAVLKDAAYRQPLIYSTLVLTSLWPASLFASWFSGSVINKLSSERQAGEGWFAEKVRDMANVWGPMETWQRITTVGMRGYAELVLSPFIQVLERGLQQKALIPALTANVNPFRVVKADSEEGIAAGLDRNTSVGFTLNPFAKDRAARRVQQAALLSNMVRQSDRKRTYLRLLAGIAVSQAVHIDLATLTELGRIPELKLSDVEALVVDPVKRRNWDLSHEALEKQLTALPLAVVSGNVEIDEEDAKLVIAQYQVVQATAKRIAELKGARKFITEKSLDFVRGSVFVKDFVLNMGREEYRFLKKIITDKFVSTNVSREFVIDHLYVVLLIAMFGKRADLAHPENLAALATGLLWVSPQHWADVGYNLYAHFFMSGARAALVYQAVKPEVAKYLTPRENFVNAVHDKNKDNDKDNLGYKLPINDRTGLIARTTDRVGGAVRDVLGLRKPVQLGQLPHNLKRQGFIVGLKEYTLNSALPWRSDIGNVVLSYVKTQTATISAFIIMQMALRSTLAHQSLTESPYGVAIMWLLAWFYIKPWWMVGNQALKVSDQQFAAKVEAFEQARQKLEWGLRESDAAERKTLLHEGTWEMFALFDEHNPGVIPAELNPLTSSASLDELGEGWLKISREQSPGDMAAHWAIPWVSTTISAIGSTLASIPMVIGSYDVANMNAQTIGTYAAAFAGIYTSVWFLGRKEQSEKWRQSVIAKYERVRARVLFGTCETELAAPTTK